MNLQKIAIIISLLPSFLIGMNRSDVKEQWKDVVEEYGGSQEGFTRIHDYGEFYVEDQNQVERRNYIHLPKGEFILVKKRECKRTGCVYPAVTRDRFSFLVKDNKPYGLVAVNDWYVFFSGLFDPDSEYHIYECPCSQFRLDEHCHYFQDDESKRFWKHITELKTNGEDILFKKSDGSVYKLGTTAIRKFLNVPFLNQRVKSAATKK